MAIAAPAKIRLGVSDARPRSTFNASVSTWFFSLPTLMTTSGQMNEFQAYKKVKVAWVARAGTLAGMQIFWLRFACGKRHLCKQLLQFPWGR